MGRGRAAAVPQRDGVPVLMAAAVASVLAVSLAVSWLSRQLVLLALLLVVGALIGTVTGRARVLARRREFAARVAQLRHGGRFLAMTPEAFCRALAELCRRDGCTAVTVLGPAGVLATVPDGRRLLLRAAWPDARTRVGPAELPEPAGSARSDLTALVTPGRFTEAASARCAEEGLRPVDQRALSLWADDAGAPPWA
ncbi:hypothetical protein ACIRBX_18750 [Kitasatospora sp. NPDC096147]|uniref:hypothetical protein n=1 Tax=Kitasatospora sp. NPDC096147 TaxID=3364093 RepID=UPI0037F29B65